jgi:endonuclease/exonuclease/phosphatase family metal-dependent hydrolase
MKRQATKAYTEWIMRLLLYNIRYGVGNGSSSAVPLPGARYMFAEAAELNRIIKFIGSQNPDIVGLIEVDTGSMRSNRVNQAEVIADALGHYSCYQSKYGEDSYNQLLPIVRKQANAFLASPQVHGERFHYFDTGIKRLIIELELDDVAIFLVHLSIKYRHRQMQLRRLHELISGSKKPVIVAGDFNTFWGVDEIYLFMKASGLSNANTTGTPSYPTRSPRFELDFILYSKQINVTGFSIPKVAFSDHLPLICDFQVTKNE